MPARLSRAAFGVVAGLALAMAVAAGPAVSAAANAGQPADPPKSRPQTTAERKAFKPGDKSPVAVVNAFNQRGFIDHDPVGAMKAYLADNFVERYPDLATDGPGTDKQRTIQFFESRGWKPGQGMTDTIYKVIGDRDYAWVFHNTHKDPKDLGTAWVDIFRVKNGLIVEHWGVGQPVSPKVSARHPMF